MGSGPACAYKASSRQSAQLSESLGEKRGGGQGFEYSYKAQHVFITYNILGSSAGISKT